MVSVLGGDVERGGLKCKDIVIRFEHLLNAAQRLSSEDFFADMNDECSAVDASGSRLENLEVHAYMGDATNEDAIQKAKVFVGMTWSVWISVS